MKNYLFFKSIISFFVVLSLLCSALPILASGEERAGEKELLMHEQSSSLAKEGLHSLLDDFEGKLDMWRAEHGAAIFTDDEFARQPASAYQGKSALVLMGKEARTVTVGATLSFTKIPDLSDAEAIAVAIAVQSGAPEGTEYTVTVKASSLDATEVRTASIEDGRWMLCYVPLSKINSGSVSGFGIEVTSVAPDGSVWAPEVYVDYVHSSYIGGPWQELPYSATSYEPSRGSVEYKSDHLEYTVNSSSASLTSSLINAKLSSGINAVAVTMTNSPNAESATLYVKTPSSKYTNELSSTVELENTAQYVTYYFPIDFLSFGATVSNLRLTFNGRMRGTVKIKEIRFCSAYFPSDSTGELTVTTSGESIKVKGSFPSLPSGTKQIALYSLLPGEDMSLINAKKPIAVSAAAKSFSFEFEKTEALSVCRFVALAKGTQSTVGTGEGAFLSSRPSSPSGIFKGAVTEGDLPGHTLAQSAYLKVKISQLEAEGDTPVSFAGAEFMLNGAALEELYKNAENIQSDGVYLMLELDFTDSAYSKNVFGTSLPGTSDASAAYYVAAVSRLLSENTGAKGITLLCKTGSLTPTIASKYVSGFYAAVNSALRSGGQTAAVAVRLEGNELVDTVRAIAKRLGDNPIPDIAVSDTARLSEISEFTKVFAVYDTELTAEEYLKTYSEARAGKAYAFFARPDAADGKDVFSLVGTKGAGAALKEILPDCAYGIEEGSFEVKKAEPRFGNISYVNMAQSLIAKPRGGCHLVSLGTVAGREALSMISDAESGADGKAYATFTFENGFEAEKVLVLELYLDYMPEGKTSADITVCINYEGGRYDASITLEDKTPLIAAFAYDEEIKGFDIHVETEGFTPRVSLLGAGFEYGKGETEGGEITEADTTETVIFEETEKESGDTGETGLLLIVILVITGMFVLLGGVLFFLEKRKGKETPDTEIPEESPENTEESPESEEESAETDESNDR